MRVLSSVSLTPEQLPILENVDPGFSLIRGAAGSGKTTTALMRLRQLCGSSVARQRRLNLKEPVCVLTLTFNRTLRGYIWRLVNEQIEDSDELSLTVETFGGWARNIIGAGKFYRTMEKARFAVCFPKRAYRPKTRIILWMR